MPALHRWTGVDMSLADALSPLTAMADPSFALFYTPEVCVIARLLKGAWWGRTARGHQQTALEDASIYEARAFNCHLEVRWQHDHGARRSAVLAETKQWDLGTNYQALDSIDSESHRTQHLLWGSVSGTSEGWTALVEQRIGSLWIPVEGGPRGTHVVLEGCEYWTRATDGNVAVIEERLTGFAPYRPDKD